MEQSERLPAAEEYVGRFATSKEAGARELVERPEPPESTEEFVG
jgi:hypothetical protein